MRIDILYFNGCPNHAPALELVREVVAETGVEAILTEVEIKHVNDVGRLAFLGSPTIRVDGEDIELARREDENYAMSCRRYGNSGVPSRELVLAALTASGTP